ncbi:MAG: hypothetical protein IJ583_06985 [Firmicutes bacterium]|nr:hypothetical protein [Bacillota bacterium]
MKKYDERIESYRQIEEIVTKMLKEEIGKSGINPMQIVSRIKKEESAEEKLIRKSEIYHRLEDITDLLGVRIICYFSDQIDECAKIIERILKVDYRKSTDKRKMIEPTSFGYISLHYICSLREDMGYPEELTGLRFEIQLRSVLQHTWAEIEHDLGYKSEFEIPKSVRRQFSRVAGLLELADEEFVNIKKQLGDYQKEITEKIKNDCADELTLDLNTLNEYMDKSRKMRRLISDIANITGARIREVSAQQYLPKLRFFGINTLGELNIFIGKQRENAVKMAERTLKDSEIDEVVSTVGLFYLCRAKLVCGTYNDEELKNYFGMENENSEYIDKKIENVKKLKAQFR